MAKKRTRKQYTPRPLPARPPVAPDAAIATAAVASSTPSAAAAAGHEYRYVVSDLKRIAIVAAAMFALLVVLALLLT